MAKKRINRDKILWIDLEMTGVKPADHPIMELGAIVTDWQLNELDRIHLVIKHDQDYLEKCFLTNPFWLDFPETKKQLLEQNQKGGTKEEFETKMIDFIQKNWNITEPDHNIILAGNTIRTDKDFIDYYFPKISAYLHYRTLDVSSFKVYFEARYGKIFAKPEPHRALDDIEGSIQELRFLDKYIKLKDKS